MSLEGLTEVDKLLVAIDDWNKASPKLQLLWGFLWQWSVSLKSATRKERWSTDHRVVGVPLYFKLRLLVLIESVRLHFASKFVPYIGAYTSQSCDCFPSQKV